MSYGEYCKDKRNGISNHYYANGVISITSNFKDGLRNGEFTKFYDNGIVKEHSKSFCLERNYQSEIYSEIGILIYKGSVFRNQKNGFGYQYSPKTGDVIYEGEFVNGKRSGFGISYFQSKVKEYEGNWDYNQKNGLGTSYFPNASKRYEGIFKDNYNTENVIHYYPNGSVKYKKIFNLKSEEWVYLSCCHLVRNGNFEGWYCQYEFHTQDFVKQKPNEQIIYYYGDFGGYITRWASGVLDEVTGSVRRYYQNGNLAFKGDYVKGKADGIGA